MKAWKKGAILGAIWGILSVIAFFRISEIIEPISGSTISVLSLFLLPLYIAAKISALVFCQGIVHECWSAIIPGLLLTVPVGILIGIMIVKAYTKIRGGK